MNTDGFVSLVRRAAGCDPYPYQQRLADEGLPGLLRVPTGAGKTLAATLPWLYRRKFHADPQVRKETARWLVLVLPQRSLVEQTVGVVRGWLERLDLTSGAGLHVLMGGASTDDREWQMRPGGEAVFVGTQDMVLSRLLLRGYAEPRSRWPIAFGLLHAGTQFVFDEVQLMGPALPTSLQLEGLRSVLGTAAPVHSMWMSATVDPAGLSSPDYPGPDRVVELTDEDRSGALRGRLAATRLIERGDVAADPKVYAMSAAELVLDRHAGGTRSIVVTNTVERASTLYDALVRRSAEAELVLLHSRFRPADRERLTERALAEPGDGGTIVVATQVLEAGVDVSARLLVTEVAPWSSIVQRAGRCNRGGEHDQARLVWLPLPATRGAAAPYDEGDLAASTEALSALDGQRVTSTVLQERAVTESTPLHPVLRRRDLLGLFDIAPDLSGNDLDVSQWIRDADMVTAAVAWRTVPAAGPEEGTGFPSREELCSVPVGELRTRIDTRGVRSWIREQVDGGWRRAAAEDVRPGAAIVLEAEQGGYLAERGWSPASNVVVPTVAVGAADDAEDVAADPLSVRPGRWISLTDHLDDVQREVNGLIGEVGDLPGLTGDQRAAAAVAGLYHDVGKAHPVFQETVRRWAGVDVLPPGGPWAKSPSRSRARHSRRYFRHELVGALLLLDPSSDLLAGHVESDLVAFLVAAHHGKARLTIRAMPGEQDEGTVLGVRDDEALLPSVLPGGRNIPPVRPRLSLLSLGVGDCGESWQARICRLRDREDLGPFRLAFLEAVVRLADWRASARYDRPMEGAGR